MASFVIQPPDAFNFSSPNEWPKWKKRFERFRTSSGLCVKPEQNQVDALLYIMARSEVCRNCRKKGHCASVCMSRRLDCVEAEPAPLESGFLGAVKTTDAGNWEPTVLVQGQPVDFKIDTGADETVLPTQVFKTLKDRPLLSAPPRQLYGPDGKLLPAAGVAQLDLIYHNRATTQDIYVLDQICTPLLGKPAIKKLQMLTLVNAVADKVNPKEEFPAVFQGLGKLLKEHKIQLQPGAKPFALSSPRRIPIPLYEKTKLELQRMQKLGVISPVDEPTEWCAQW
ncbi:hypothetical protein MTO96_029401 [Rhipicephalus appendiculatus]